MNIPMAVYALYDTSSEDLYDKACGRERMFDGENEEDENMLHPAPHACFHNSTVEDVTAHHRNMVSDLAHKFDDDYIAIAESKE